MATGSAAAAWGTRHGDGVLAKRAKEYHEARRYRVAKDAMELSILDAHLWEVIRKQSEQEPLSIQDLFQERLGVVLLAFER